MVLGMLPVEQMMMMKMVMVMMMMMMMMMSYRDLPARQPPGGVWHAACGADDVRGTHGCQT